MVRILHSHSVSVDDGKAHFSVVLVKTLLAYRIYKCEQPDSVTSVKYMRGQTVLYVDLYERKRK